MEKKLYMYPLTQVEMLNTKELMQVSPESSFPVDPNQAPARDKVF